MPALSGTYLGYLPVPYSCLLLAESTFSVSRFLIYKHSLSLSLFLSFSLSLSLSLSRLSPGAKTLSRSLSSFSWHRAYMLVRSFLALDIMGSARHRAAD